MIVHKQIQENKCININTIFKNTPSDKLIYKFKNSLLLTKIIASQITISINIQQREQILKSINILSLTQSMRKYIDTLAPQLTKHRSKQALY